MPLTLPFRKVFISGAAGVIGQEMVALLATLPGLDVLAADLKPRPATFPAHIRYRQGDLNFMTEAELAAFGPEVFIHLAATFERSTETYGFWEENFRHNVQLSHHLMTVAKDLPSLRRVVFASSYLIYEPALYTFETPPAAPRRLRENDPIRPRNLTGMAKLAHEIELRFLDGFRAEQFTTVCARIFRGYGRHSRDVVSRWVRAALAGEEILVYGAESLFDYLYAADSAEGLLRLAAAESATGILNLGTGHARRVADIVAELQRHFPGLRTRYEPSPVPFEGSEADISAYVAATGWTPPTTLETAIPAIIAYEQGRAEASAPATPGHVLVTSAAAKIPLVRAVQHAAARLGPGVRVMGGDLNANALAQHFTDDFWAMPRLSDDALPGLLAECQARGIAHLIPTRDGELAFWARHREALAAAGVAVLVSTPAAVARCLDKLEFAQFGQQHGLPVIATALRPEDLPGTPTLLVVKERHGAGSRSLGLELPPAEALAHARSLQEPIFQPFIHGQEISVDAYVDRQGQVHGLVARTRDVVVNGESQVSTTLLDEALTAQLRALVAQLGLYGPLVLQALVDEAGALHLIECNCRFGGASTLGVAAGVDSFFWFLQEAAGANLADFPFRPAATALRQVRAAADVVTAV